MREGGSHMLLLAYKFSMIPERLSKGCYKHVLTLSICIIVYLFAGLNDQGYGGRLLKRSGNRVIKRLMRVVFKVFKAPPSDPLELIRWVEGIGA